MDPIRGLQHVTAAARDPQRNVDFYRNIGKMGLIREPVGDLGGMPAFLGCSDVDPHIPFQRVQETTSLLKAMGAEVTERIYPAMGHTINDEEIELARKLVEQRL